MDRPCLCLMVLVVLGAAFQGSDGYRFKYYKRFKPKVLHYTPHAYNNYISYSPNSGWSQSSSYIKYVPEVRQAQTYKFYRGPYTGNINMYFAMASSDSYKGRHIPEDAPVCSNYDANTYGDAMGIFNCPNAWEPGNFTQCCGEDYAEFCCSEHDQESNWVTIVAVVAGVIVAIVVIVVIIIFCKRRQKQKKKNPKSVTALSGSLGSIQRPMGPVSLPPKDAPSYGRGQSTSLPEKHDSPYAYSSTQ